MGRAAIALAQFVDFQLRVWREQANRDVAADLRGEQAHDRIGNSGSARTRILLQRAEKSSIFRLLWIMAVGVKQEEDNFAMNQGIVTAATRVVFMIGTPIAQVRSPTLFNRYFAERRIERIMVPLEVSVDTLAGFVAMVREAENCDGFVATLPHKRALLTMVDEAGPTTRARKASMPFAAIRTGAFSVTWRTARVLERRAGRRTSSRSASPPSWPARARREPRSPSNLHNAAVGNWRSGRDQTTRSMRWRAGLAGRNGIEVNSGYARRLGGYDMAINATPLRHGLCAGHARFRLNRSLRCPPARFAADAITEPAETSIPGAPPGRAACGPSTGGRWRGASSNVAAGVRGA